MTMKLHELLDRVVDRATFLDFVQALIEDREDEVQKEREQPSSPCGSGANGWQNGTIEAFLDASLRWAEDSSDNEDGLPEQPSWQAFADFLYCGKIYE
jgi:hypothetical protein